MNEDMIKRIGDRMAALGTMINVSHRNPAPLNKFDHEFNGMVELLKAMGLRHKITCEINNIRQIESIEIEGKRFLCEGF